MKYLIILLLSINAFAVTPLEKGQVAPETGYLFSTYEEKKLRQDRDIKDTKVLKLEELGVVKDKIIDAHKQEVEQYVKTNERLHKELSKKPTGFWGKVGFFMLGAVLTGLVSYGTTRALRR